MMAQEPPRGNLASCCVNQFYLRKCEHAVSWQRAENRLRQMSHKATLRSASDLTRSSMPWGPSFSLLLTSHWGEDFCAEPVCIRRPKSKDTLRESCRSELPVCPGAQNSALQTGECAPQYASWGWERVGMSGERTEGGKRMQLMGGMISNVHLLYL